MKHIWYRLQRRTKISSRRTDDIKVLSEQLGYLQITNKTSDKAMSVALVPVTINANEQAVMPKNMVLDLGWFNRDKTKFKDWWRGM